MRDLAKQKKVASASQKKFFKDMVQYLYENVEAYERFLKAEQNGDNTLATTTTDAHQESTQNPSSPLKPPEPEQNQEEKQEGEESEENLVKNDE